MSLHTPIRDPQNYGAVQEWLKENIPAVTDGAPEAFLQMTAYNNWRRLMQERPNDPLVLAIDKIPTAFLNVEWDKVGYAFEVKSADMVSVEYLMESLQSAYELARMKQAVLRLQDILRENNIQDEAWFITGLDESVKKAADNAGGTNYKHYLYTLGALGEYEEEPFKVPPTRAASLGGRQQADMYAKALRAFGQGVVSREKRFLESGLGLKGYRIDVQAVLDITFPELSEHAELVSSLVD